MSEHTERDGKDADAADGAAFAPPSYSWLLPTVFFLTVFVCAAFTAAASWVLWLVLLGAGAQEAPGFMARLFVKGLLFLGLTAVSGWALLRLSRAKRGDRPGDLLEARETWRTRAGLVAALVFAAALAVPNLTKYPKAEPDEIHHLVVARNLAEYGLYASGHPDTGFTLFDDYDSVGAPVIVPIAGAFRLAGTELAAARGVMAAFFLLLCMTAYLLLKPVFGPAQAVAGVFVMTMALHSIYLARTLYGEAPALLFLTVGLLLWRRALKADATLAYGALSGVAFAFAVLCKPFMLVAAWAVLGAVIFDRLTHRRIRWRHVVLPTLGFVLVISTWWGVQTLFRHDVSQAAHSTLNEYKYNLMFGFHSVAQTLGWFRDHGATVAATILAMAFILPVIFHRRYDPPTIALFLTALLFAYWWTFFTPGHISRYLWYSLAIGGTFAGILMAFSLQYALTRGLDPAKRILCVGIIGLVSVPALHRAYVQFDRVYAHDEMRDDLALAGFVNALPKEFSIATTFWPVEKMLNFFAQRSVARLKTVPGCATAYDVIIIDQRQEQTLLVDRTPDRVIGRYRILLPKE